MPVLRATGLSRVQASSSVLTPCLRLHALPIRSCVLRSRWCPLPSNTQHGTRLFETSAAWWSVGGTDVTVAPMAESTAWNAQAPCRGSLDRLRRCDSAQKRGNRPALQDAGNRNRRGILPRFRGAKPPAVAGGGCHFQPCTVTEHPVMSAARREDPPWDASERSSAAVLRGYSRRDHAPARSGSPKKHVRVSLDWSAASVVLQNCCHLWQSCKPNDSNSRRSTNPSNTHDIPIAFS